MKLFNLKNKEKGFTLVELVLIVGIIALMTIGIYIKYRSISNNAKIQQQTQDLYALSNKINGAYQSSASLATLNNTTAIAGGLVPTELINSPNIISRFGTTLTLAPSPVPIAGVSGYSITINNITPKFCGSMGTSKYANEVDEVWISGVSRKTTGTSLTNANMTAIITACNTATNIEFRNRMYYNTAPENYLQNRPTQTSKYYIPTLASSVNSASTSCSGGASWTGSFCSCPAGTEWTGSMCASNVTIPTNCGYGTGATLGSTNCSTLPTTKAQETVYNGTTFVTQNITYYSASAPTTRAACTTAGGYWDAITNICGGIVPGQTAGTKTSLAPTYQGGRYLPQAMNGQVNAQIPVTTVNGAASQCSAAGGNWDGKICNYCPTPTTIGSVNTAIVNANNNTQIALMSNNPTTNPRVVSGHATSSTWNVDRCVTPAAAAAPPYPQTVAW